MVNKYYFIALGVIGVIIAGILVFAIFHQKFLRAGAGNGVPVARKKKDPFYFVNIIFRKVPILRAYFLKVRKRVEILYPADPMSINKKTSSILVRATLIMAMGIGAAVFLGEGNLFYTCSVIMVAYVFAIGSADNAADKMQALILEQFVQYLDAVTHEYHKCKMVEQSLYRAMDKQPFEISMHAQNIYDIITQPSSKMNQKVAEYVGTEPSKHFLTFLSTCASTKEFGDTVMPDGGSVFLSNLHILKDSVRTDILQSAKTAAKFKGATPLCLSVVLLIKPAQAALSGIIKELAPYYTGMYGTISVAATFIAAVACYRVIMILKDGGTAAEKMTEDSIWSKVASLKQLKPLLNSLEAKNYTKFMRTDMELRASGDHTGPRAYIVKKLVFAAAGFLITVFLLSSVTVADKVTMLKDFSSDFENTAVPSEQYRTSMEKAARNYASVAKKAGTGKYDRDRLANEIVAGGEIKNRKSAELIADAILVKLDKYDNTYFKWYFLVVSIIVGGISFIVPDVFMALKRGTIAQRKNDEVLQFQSLVLILMHMNGTTLNVILEWIERFSYCFKTSIGECRVNLSKGAFAALETMKERERDCQMFTHFVDNMADIDNSGVVRAFAELESDRKFAEKERELQFDQALETKGNISFIVSLVPFFTMIIAFIFIPTGHYALTMFQTLSAFG